MMMKIMIEANRKRAAENPIGGRSSSPTLIKIQVVPQIRQRISQTKILTDLLFEDRSASILFSVSIVETKTGFALFQQPPAPEIA